MPPYNVVFLQNLSPKNIKSNEPIISSIVFGRNSIPHPDAFIKNTKDTAQNSPQDCIETDKILKLLIVRITTKKTVKIKKYM